eukprot:436088-Pyramimonas_sp.AAC.1
MGRPWGSRKAGVMAIQGINMVTTWFNCCCFREIPCDPKGLHQPEGPLKPSRSVIPCDPV